MEATKMKLAISLLALGLFATAACAQDVTGMKGWIEDGLTHKVGTSSDAVKKNIANGAPYVFIDDASKRVWKIDDPEVVKGHEGHHISFNGGVDKVSHVVHIQQIAMLKNQKPGAEADAVGH
jgi:hypothetical protein